MIRASAEAFAVSDSFMYAGTDQNGVWRRLRPGIVSIQTPSNKPQEFHLAQSGNRFEFSPRKHAVLAGVCHHHFQFVVLFEPTFFLPQVESGVEGEQPVASEIERDWLEQQA